LLPIIDIFAAAITFRHIFSFSAFHCFLSPLSFFIDCHYFATLFSLILLILLFSPLPLFSLAFSIYLAPAIAIAISICHIDIIILRHGLLFRPPPPWLLEFSAISLTAYSLLIS
jgi:hypothetical protein